MAESTNNKYPPRPNAPPNQESFEMDEVDKNSTSEQEELMPKAVLEGEADDLSTWAWLSAVCGIKVGYTGIMPTYLPSILAISIDSTGQPGSGVLDISGAILVDTARSRPTRSFFHIGNLGKALIPSHHPADAIQQYGVPRNHPLLIPLTTGFAFVAFLGYNKPVDEIGSLGFLVFMGNGICALYGSYLILFNGPTLRSKKTGADKHTSSFLFGNKNAASVQKKKWRKEHAK
ncbi:unnamed protein product [Rhizoctonia solani]|uniref:Uncharacterized protein n=1 Tax=Rhizoctonia solani TaxID=456999 RepID=A0A8H3D4C4_9AGAM|nr:unnamed protein product [Rhizoctonia solani]CAE6509350.1 unnamed protein product [Rhizoctonia solani]